MKQIIIESITCFRGVPVFKIHQFTGFFRVCSTTVAIHGDKNNVR